LRRQDGGTELWKRLRQRDAYIAKTRTAHWVNGGQKQNGIRKTGPRHRETRDAKNVVIRASGTMRREKDHEGEDNAPKREGESLCAKQY
jgi:hypothetical protein